jgi:hypothetical protein
MVAPDGSHLELTEVVGARARISYGKGAGKDGGAHCEVCVMEDNDLRDMLAEAFQRHNTGVTEVEIVT